MKHVRMLRPDAVYPGLLPLVEAIGFEEAFHYAYNHADSDLPVETVYQCAYAIENELVASKEKEEWTQSHRRSNS